MQKKYEDIKDSLREEVSEMLQERMSEIQDKELKGFLTDMPSSTFDELLQYISTFSYITNVVAYNFLETKRYNSADRIFPMWIVFFGLYTKVFSSNKDPNILPFFRMIPDSEDNISFTSEDAQKVLATSARLLENIHANLYEVWSKENRRGRHKDYDQWKELIKDLGGEE